MEVRDRIIEEATNQFFKYGIRNVTMDDIAVAIGISKRTVYEVFKAKNELIETCLLFLNRKEEDRHLEITSAARNVIEAIFASMQDGIKLIHLVNPAFFYDLKKYYPKLWRSINDDRRKKNYSQMHKQLRKGINEGLFRKDFDIEIVSKLFHEQLNLIGDEEIFPRDKYDRVDLFKNLVINFARGISTKKGIELIDQMLK